MDRPAKRVKLLDDSDSESDTDQGNGKLEAFKINNEYAKRHEHNAARSERQRLEEKLKDDATDSDSDSESEDDEGELATKELDDEILATLNAIKSKDPRVYNKDVTFYRPDEVTDSKTVGKDKIKPIHLRDYHRQNLLGGIENEEEDSPVPTYAQEQSTIKKELLDQLHKLPKDDEADSAEDSDGDDFLVRKPQKAESAPEKRKAPELDVDSADRDPETFLSNFMASRAWVPSDGSRFQPLESDDEDELENAEKYEAAYNLRFEDSNKLNENLITHSRDAAAKYSVRRDEPTGRQKSRVEQQARKEEAKREREDDKARLRRLKIEEAHEKWLRLKEAAGLKHQNLPDEKLMGFLEKGFEDDQWDSEMAKLLGESYYDEKDDVEIGEEGASIDSKSKRKAKKPKWEDDIDIGDIDPGFTTREEEQAKGFTLSSDEDEGQDFGLSNDARGTVHSASSKQKKKNAEKKRSEQKRQARLERRKIEEMIDASMDDSLSMTKHNGFRYRETSPTTLGLSAREILMADDAQLNQYVGLKKLAAFRDESKKARERKNLGKKARLRQWRKETFGREEQAKDEEFEAWFNRTRGVEAENGVSTMRANTEEKKSKKKKKKSKKRKATEIEV